MDANLVEMSNHHFDEGEKRNLDNLEHPQC